MHIHAQTHTQHTLSSRPPRAASRGGERERAAGRVPARASTYPLRRYLTRELAGASERLTYQPTYLAAQRIGRRCARRGAAARLLPAHRLVCRRPPGFSLSLSLSRSELPAAVAAAAAPDCSLTLTARGLEYTLTHSVGTRGRAHAKLTAPRALLSLSGRGDSHAEESSSSSTLGIRTPGVQVAIKEREKERGV